MINSIEWQKNDKGLDLMLELASASKRLVSKTTFVSHEDAVRSLIKEFSGHGRLSALMGDHEVKDLVDRFASQMIWEQKKDRDKRNSPYNF